MTRLVPTEVSVVQGNARDWLGFAKHDSDALADDGYAFEGGSEVQDYEEDPSGQLFIDNGIHIAIVRPRNFRDAATVGEYYRQEVPVIINLEDMDKADATRIIDFVSGLILGLGGDLERISRRTFLIVPADATIITTHDGLTEEGFFNQALRSINDSAVVVEDASKTSPRMSSIRRRSPGRPPPATTCTASMPSLRASAASQNPSSAASVTTAQRCHRCNGGSR